MKPPVGKSVAQFPVRGWRQDQVLSAAVGLGNQAGFAVESWGPNHVLMTKGSALLTGKRLVVVMAADAPDGANVSVQAWLEGIADANVSPHRLITLGPQRETWWLASSLVAQLGLDPEAVFRHS